MDLMTLARDDNVTRNGRASGRLHVVSNQLLIWKNAKISHFDFFRDCCALFTLAIVTPTMAGRYANKKVSRLGEVPPIVTSYCPGGRDCDDICVTIDCHGIR